MSNQWSCTRAELEGGRTDVVTSSGDRMCGWRLTASLIEDVAVAFGSFICRYGGFFRTRTRDNAAVAERYLQGLAQAEEATFAAMATVVEQGCEQQFQHFISNSPWRHEPVVEQIGRESIVCSVASRPAR